MSRRIDEGGSRQWSLTAKLLLLAGLLAAVALVLNRTAEVATAVANLRRTVANVFAAPELAKSAVSCEPTLGPINRLDPKITHPELGRVDDDKKVLQEVFLGAPGTITTVDWTCEGEGCGWTWPYDLRKSGNDATWVGKANSSAPGRYWFKVHYDALGSCPPG
ncbi:MAG: hypothetical protein U0807_09975 [Candidatus Binatia bacterium]